MSQIYIQIGSTLIAIGVGVVSKIVYDWLRNTNQKPTQIQVLEKEDKPVLDERNETRLIKIGDTLIETNLLLRDIRDSLKEHMALSHEVLKEVRSLQ